MGDRINQKDFLSVLIFTYNAAHEIKECIESAFLLSEDVRVIDLKSTDNTAEIAGAAGAKISSFPHPLYVELIRDSGIKSSTSEWVFILDVDERMTKTLATEITSTLMNPEHSHYKIPRRNIYSRTDWLQYGGWWPDYQLRLLNTSAFKEWPKVIHSTPLIKGSLGYLKNPFLHYFHSDIESMVKKTILFENIESDLLYKANKKANTPIFFRKFGGEFFRRIIKNVGFLDGTIGIIEGIYQAFSKTITYLYLYEKKKSRPL